MAGFPTTRHSVIERLRTEEGPPRREAFGDLVDGYWKPVYKYLRMQWQLPVEEAEDAAQAFFAEAFEKDWFDRYDPSKARFRTFVRMCVDRLVMKQQQAAHRDKRGGAAAVLSLDFASAEHEVLGQAMVTAPEADELFKREFVRALFDRAVRAVREDCLARGRELHWRLFERYDLSDATPARNTRAPGAPDATPARNKRAPGAPDGDGISYTALASEFGLTQGQVTGYLAQMRAAFRTHAVAALEALCANRDEFRREARELLGLEIE